MSIQNKKRILHITPFFPPDKGGISNLVNNLCTALESYDNEIHIITSTHLKNKSETQNEIKKNLTTIKSFYLPGWPYSTLKSFSIPLDLGFRINRLIKNGNYDAIHVHGHHYPIGWMAIKSAFKHKVPVVLSIHGMYALNPNVLGGKTIIEDVFNKFIFKKNLAKSKVVIGGTPQVIEYAKKYGKSTIKFSIIPNGVNTINYQSNMSNKKQFRIKYNISQDSIVVLFVGRFEEVKGVLEFAKAAKMLIEHDQKFEIIIVGDGSLSSTIRRIAGAIKNIKILNWQSPDKIHEIYIASDIFVFPSKFEALPLTILEAMNANLHIIYSNVGGVKDILEKYNKKTLLPNIIPTNIISNIIKVASKQFFNAIDNPSLEYAKTFDWNNIAKEVNEIYDEIKRK